MKFLPFLALATTCVMSSPALLAAESTSMSDARDKFDVKLFAGWQFERFTAGNPANFTNPQQSGSQHDHWLLDLQFNYELARFDVWQQQWPLWLYGHTDRTTLSTEVSCKDNPAFSGCIGAATAPVPANGQSFAILRNADAVEAHAGLRLETFQVGEAGNQARFYVSVESGYASLDQTSDMAQLTVTSVGVVTTEGRFMNSFIEWGYGRNELFQRYPSGREHVRVHLEHAFNAPFINKFAAYVETDVDYDHADAADSVIVRVGFQLPFSGWGQHQ